MDATDTSKDQEVAEVDEVQLLADEADVNEVAADKSETANEDENALADGNEEKKDEKSEEKTEDKETTETILEIDGKKVKKTTGGAKKGPGYKSSGRDGLRRDKKRAIDMRRRTLLISNITLEDTINEKLKNVLETCYHCQIRFLQTKVGKRGIAECRFNTVEDATKAEGELKEIAVEDRTIEIRNLEDSGAPSTWYEVGKELDKYLKDGSVKDEEEKADGEKPPAEKEKDPIEEELATCDEDKTLVVLNLPATTTEEMLQAIFSDAQKIRMPLDTSNQCKGHAFLEFETAELCTEAQPKYEGISIEEDQDDRQIYVQNVKDYRKAKAKAAERDKRGSSRRRSSRDPGGRRLRLQAARRQQMNRLKRGLYRRGFRSNRGRDRSFGQSSFRNRMFMDRDRKRDMQGGRRDMNWGQNMMWNADMMSNMPNLLNMMGRMPASLMGINPFMGNSMNFQNQDTSNRNVDDYNRNRKRKVSGDQDFYRGDNRRNIGNESQWKNRRFENQSNYGSAGGSYNDRDRSNRGRSRDRNLDNRGFRRYY